MASKKPETPEVQTPQEDYSNLNVYQKLLRVRTEFLTGGTSKSGVNLHAEFQYFELKDIVPLATKLFAKYELLLQISFSKEREEAYAVVIDANTPSNEIVFSIPLQFIAEPGKFRMNEVQGVGAVVTYYRRYLYQLVLDIVENDSIDNQKPVDTTKSAPTTASKTKKAPATPAQRENLKQELTTESPASEEQIAELKEALKRLLTLDPDQEEFVQSVALKTNSFTEITAFQATTLIDGVNDMIAEYE